MKPFLRSLRVDQWFKNAFVVMPLVFAHRLTDTALIFHALVYAGCFCLVSSAVYLLNDVADRKSDRVHPVKKNRPVASGQLSTGAALIAALVFAAAGIGAAQALTNFAGVVILALYAANNVLYSLALKRVVILDVVLIALGFVLRVAGGAAAINVEASVWLIMCTFLISLFLGFCKRKQEIMLLGGQSEDHRRVLEHYNIRFLDHMISVVSACTVISYALYTVAPETVEKFGTHSLIYSFPFVLYGVFRYMYNINLYKSDKSTTEILLGDRSLLVNILLWFGATVFII
jgi:4-hydroxybenzoate polyprenyltransferase